MLEWAAMYQVAAHIFYTIIYNMIKIIKKLLIFLSGLIIVQIVFVVISSDNTFLPSPLEVLVAFIIQLQQGEIILDILMSLKRVLIGFALSIIVAVPLAILCCYSRYLNNTIKPFVEIIRPIPPIAWIPISILLFGLGDQSAYFIVFLGAFFPIFTNSYFGAVSLPKIYRNVARTFEIDNSIFIRKILFYFSLPYIFTGLRIGIGMAWMSVIAAELIGAQSGLGYFIQLNRLLLRIDNVVLGMVLIGMVGYILTKLLMILEGMAMPWMQKKRNL